MEYTQMKKMTGTILFLDFEKAFDSVRWEFLHKVLKAHNFGQSFMNWIRIIYKNISSCILNNGFSSGYFQLGRGVRQGDPLSPLLFVLVVESMASAIRSDKGIKGITIHHEETKLVQFADDTTLMLSDISSIKNAIRLLEKFARVSGLKLNLGKSKAMWLGEKSIPNRKLFNLTWTDEPIKALGIYFCKNEKQAEEKNFSEKIKSLKRQLNLWKGRYVSIFGRILIIKCLAISKFVFLASMVHIPDWVIRLVEKEIYDFLWQGKGDKIKRKTVINPIEKGGLNMVDFQSTT